MHRNIDDSRVWHESGVEMTSIKRNPGLPDASNRRIRQHLEDNDHQFEGDWLITPSYIFFEIPEEAFLFQLTFTGNY